MELSPSLKFDLADPLASNPKFLADLAQMLRLLPFQAKTHLQNLSIAAADSIQQPRHLFQGLKVLTRIGWSGTTGIL
jgi:hypothetical protein